MGQHNFVFHLPDWAVLGSGLSIFSTRWPGDKLTQQLNGTQKYVPENISGEE